MPTVAGNISINLKFDTKGGVTGIVEIPEGTSGIFQWKGKLIYLTQSHTKIKI